MTAETLGEIIGEYGYEIIISFNGEQAIEAALNDDKIDLVLMDINLGKGINGTQAAGIILNSRNIPVVFLSNHSEHEIIEKAEKISPYGFVMKNSGINALLESVKMAFKLFDTRMKLFEKENTLRKIEEKYRLLKNQHYRYPI